MSEQTCPDCGAIYDDNSSHEHQCPDEERDERIGSLERRVEALEEELAELRLACGLPEKRP